MWSRCSTQEHWSVSYQQEFNTHYKYFQNDEYAEYRKAQADGKVIQYQSLSNTWMDITDNFEIMKSPYLRIKPEEPEFKVGNWIQHPDNYVFMFTVLFSLGLILEIMETWLRKKKMGI